MKIVIAGGGRAGLSVAAHLADAGHEVTLIDKDASVSAIAFSRHGIVALTGDATDPRLMEESEVAQADVVVAMLPRDADNLAVAALGRALGAKRIMVRVKDDAYRSIYIGRGVDRILSETDVFIGALATAIEYEPVRTSMLLGNGDAVAFELQLPPSSGATGKKVSDLASSPTFPPSCVLAGFYGEDGRIEAPRGASLIPAEGTLLLVSRRSEMSAVIEFFIRPKERKETKT